MTELDRAWAETQIEAMADGSLSAEAKQRMLVAMSRDAGLAERVERARAVRVELRRLADVPVPRGLLRRLWRIPSPRPGSVSRLWMPAGVLATAVAVALSFGVFTGQPEVSPTEEERMAAVADFTIAMSYLQKSMVMAHNEINEAVGSGVLGALAASSGMMNRTESNGSEGEQQNDD